MFRNLATVVYVALYCGLAIAAPVVLDDGNPRPAALGVRPAFDQDRGFVPESGTLVDKTAMNSGSTVHAVTEDPTNPGRVTAESVKLGLKVTDDSLNYAKNTASSPTHPGVAGLKRVVYDGGNPRPAVFGVRPAFDQDRGFVPESGTLVDKTAMNSGNTAYEVLEDPTNPGRVTAESVELGLKVTDDSLNYAKNTAKNPTNVGVAPLQN
ncbi:hypothetical protein BKA62DRAFT_699241 [Auriculariales sp. MPI-PUGE-AT-0066]|nr:hypothetical protein BKA62DRAFT_699241 [Auriculariales sp. MPI-PUGE-AT-0066]